MENEIKSLKRQKKKAEEDKEEFIKTKEIEEAHKQELTLEGDFDEKVETLEKEYTKVREELKNTKK